MPTRHPDGPLHNEIIVAMNPDGTMRVDVERHLDKPSYFSMRTLLKHEPCGTIACLCGSLAWMMKDDRVFLNFDVAGEVLGINQEQARALFTPPGWSISNVTAHGAARVMRHLALTGEVDWGILNEEAI